MLVGIILVGILGVDTEGLDGKLPYITRYLCVTVFGRGDDRVGNPRRAQISQFELFELVLLFNLDKLLPVERFEATVSQSRVPSPLLALVNREDHGQSPK